MRICVCGISFEENRRNDGRIVDYMCPACKAARTKAFRSAQAWRDANNEKRRAATAVRRNKRLMATILSRHLNGEFRLFVTGFNSTWHGKRQGKNPQVVSIMRRINKYYPGAKRYIKLAPSDALLDKWNASDKGATIQAEYTAEFNAYLATLNPHEVVSELVESTGGDVYMACICGNGKFCHRMLVAAWLRKAGYRVDEV
jgi:hypothetical protein